jgi:DNA-binding CsgD family transcriptional regulator
MLLVQKKDVFAEITDDLKELKNYLRNEESRKKLLDIFQKLNRHRVGEEYMEVFDVHFEKVHHNFFEGLKALSPSLTQRELRLCAFVKMGLTNKEIAPLLGISLRGVENARYRIRKKLDVANEDNFAAFLEGVGSAAGN